MATQVTSFKHLVNVSWLKLAPFLKSVIIYAVVGFYGFFGNNLLSTALKCLPIFCLMAFIIFMGFKFTDEFRYHKFILSGLAFSSVGDAFLDYADGELFSFGMLAFAVAQLCYISAFGFKPLKLIIGLIISGIGAFAISLMFKNFDEILKYGVPFYSTLLLTMMWRALSRIQSNNLLKVICAIGSVFFVVSDGIIAFNMFYTPIKYSRIIIMSTYYFAQLCITLSILDHEVKPKTSLKSN